MNVRKTYGNEQSELKTDGNNYGNVRKIDETCTEHVTCMEYVQELYANAEMHRTCMEMHGVNGKCTETLSNGDGGGSIDKLHNHISE